ncbi:hypothetical protein QCN27_14175 [Cereibacter sp. SYSU M97828]|nr:hypothetical protein [Cereibacter flavus]
MTDPRKEARAIPFLLLIAVVVAGLLAYGCSWNSEDAIPETLEPSDALDFDVGPDGPAGVSDPAPNANEAR